MGLRILQLPHIMSKELKTFIWIAIAFFGGYAIRWFTANPIILNDEKIHCEQQGGKFRVVLWGSRAIHAKAHDFIRMKNQ